MLAGAVHEAAAAAQTGEAFEATARTFRGAEIRAVCAWGGENSPMRCADRKEAESFCSLKNGNFAGYVAALPGA
jgi:hypothetical protein